MGNGVVIDCCTLGVIANPNDPRESVECRAWADSLREQGTLVGVPEIAIYESKRELLRIKSAKGLAKLDEVANELGCLPISGEVLDLAAELWAELRGTFGKSGTDGLRLDADVIICAHARLFAIQNSVAVKIATDNTRHFLPLVDGKLVVDATEWHNIT